MGIFIQRIEKLFMTISSLRADEPLLANLSRMVQVANRVAESCKQSIAARMEAGIQTGSRNPRF